MTTMTDRPCHHQRSPFLPLRPLLLSVALLSFLFCHQLLPADANDGNDCSCPPSNYQDTKKETTGRPTPATTTKPPLTRIAYLITVHNQRTIDDALPLFKAIRSPQNIILIHVDRKCDWAVYVGSELREEVERCPCGASVLVDSVHSAEWSSWSMNDPTFWGMGQLVSNPTFQNRWDVFVNLSGDTLPVFTADALSRRFTEPAFKGINFVTSSSCETGYWPTSVYTFPEWWHKRAHYTNDPEGNPVLDYTDDDGHPQTSTLVIHFGSQWMVLQPDFVRYLVRSLQRRDSLPSRFKDYLIETGRLMTDETFIPTLLMHVHPFNTTLPRVNENGTLADAPEMETIRYERMDEHVPTAFGYFPVDQRYEVPESSLADQPKPWGPYFLGVYDLYDIRASGALYARKISAHVDPNLVDLLPVSSIQELPSIRWPDEVRISAKPNWAAKYADVLRKNENIRDSESEDEWDDESDETDMENDGDEQEDIDDQDL